MRSLTTSWVADRRRNSSAAFVQDSCARATESRRRAVVDAGFKNLDLPSVIGFTLADNTASRARMIELGMQYEGIIQHAACSTSCTD